MRLEKQAAQCNILQNNKGNKDLSQRKQVHKPKLQWMPPTDNKTVTVCS